MEASLPFNRSFAHAHEDSKPTRNEWLTDTNQNNSQEYNSPLTYNYNQSLSIIKYNVTFFLIPPHLPRSPSTGLHLISYARTTYPLRLTPLSTNPRSPSRASTYSTMPRWPIPLQWNVLHATQPSTSGYTWPRRAPCLCHQLSSLSLIIGIWWQIQYRTDCLRQFDDTRHISFYPCMLVATQILPQIYPHITLAVLLFPHFHPNFTLVPHFYPTEHLTPDLIL